MRIIANPRAGHGRGSRSLQELHDAIRRRGLDCTPVLTEHPGHATRLARRAAEAGEPRIAVLGGDGTISEAVNGLVGSDTVLGVIPTGTGNDIARSLGLPIGDVEAALEIAREGAPRAIDVGHERDRHFVSVLGIGFPSIVADEANRVRWLRGSPAFFFAVYKGLHRLRAVPLEIHLDTGTIEMECVAVLVQNTPYTGGGLLMAPEADVDDGILDVVLVDDIGKLGLMINFPRVYHGGHFSHPSFTAHRTRSVRVRASEPLPKMFDGDLCGRTPLEAEVVPDGVRIAIPGPR